MIRPTLVLFAAAWILGPSAAIATAEPARSVPASPPNVVFILCDDLGYGDVRGYNPEGKIATPHMDRLAAQGMRFTDAHTTSGVCSPTRYSLITGRYNWRSRLQSGVLGGLSPRLIENDRMTVASYLKQRGYATACVGKWHLGMDWVRPEGKPVTELNIETPDQYRNVDYVRPIENGPNAVGIDSYFGISASLDMVPYTFLRDNRVAAYPSAEKAFPMTLGRDPEKTTRLGPAAPDFEAEDVLRVLTDEALAILNRQAGPAKASPATPFFLYMPLASPHTPIVPTAPWRGKSGLSPYADFVMETDAAIGRVLDALDRLGLAANTLVIVTSDNGCSPQANFPELLEKGHNPSGPFRGTKADVYEGGHRVPFLARWPGVVAPGSRCDRTICLMDFMATCAEILGTPLPENAGEDSVSFLPLLKGENRPTRDTLVSHSIQGRFAIREGAWKLLLCPGSGGWSAPRDPEATRQGLPPIRLYNLDNDPAERENVQAAHPEIVARLTQILRKQVDDGRSTPGTPGKNTVPVDILKIDRNLPVNPTPRKKAG